MSRSKSALTLIELMIAVVLLGLILLTGATLDLASRRFLRASDRQAELQNEINPGLLRIKKNINLAKGYSNSPGIVADAMNQRIRIRIDDTGTDSIRFNGDENWVAYARDIANNRIEYFGPYLPGAVWPSFGTGEVISNRVTVFDITPIPSPYDSSLIMGATIKITACYNPTGVAPDACNSPNNPQLVLQTRAHALSQSAR